MGTLLQNLDQIEGRIEQLEIMRKGCQLCPLTVMVTKHGKDAGDLVGATPEQYRKLTGRRVDPGGLVKGKIPYDFILDQLIVGDKITGYRGDQVDKLKDDIETAYKRGKELTALKGERDSLITRINKEAKEGDKPTVSTFKGQACDKTATDDCITETHTNDDTTVTLQRQRSYWDVAIDGDHVTTLPLAADARRLAKAITTTEKPDKPPVVRRKRSDRGQRRTLNLGGGVSIRTVTEKPKRKSKREKVKYPGQIGTSSAGMGIEVDKRGRGHVRL